jgi:hypothetical protein
MKVAVYTSCSSNYLPKARVLASTLKAFHPDAKLALLLCDQTPSFVDFEQEQFDHVWRPEDLGYDRGWMFEHNVMELCTAVKGRGLLRLMETTPDADLYLYLDPDVVLYHSLDPIVDYIGDNEIGLVPHITTPEMFELGVTLTELSVMRHGTYNLGHLILRPGKNATEMAKWWANRLDRYCFDDPEYGLFTDQRWCDLVPSLFDKVAILRQPNLDVASWNAGSREISKVEGADGRYMIDGYPLITYHFSGTGPTGAHSRVRNALNPGNAAQAEIEREYEDAIAQNGQKILAQWPFFGNYFDDGTPVTARARTFYRRHADLKRSFPDPFLVNDNCYLSWLRGNFPEAVNGVMLRADELEKAFNDIFDEHYYCARYPDVANEIAAGKFLNAREHYVAIGSERMYDPNHYFVSLEYAEKSRDLGGFEMRSGSLRATLLWHYLSVGMPSGIEPLPDFNGAFYLSSYPGLVEALRQRVFSTPLAHFIHFGDCEQRAPGPKFNPKTYLSNNPRACDLIAKRAVPGPYGAYLALGSVPGRVDMRFSSFM